MNSRIVKGYWNAVRKKINTQQGKPTDYEIRAISEELAEALQKAYRYDKLKIKKAINTFMRDS